MADAARLALTIISVAIVLAVGVALAGAIGDTADSDSGAVDKDLKRQPAALSGGDYYELRSDGTGTNETVRNTTGYELQLQGEDDSDFAFDKGLETDSSDNYTVCTFAKVNSTAAEANRTLVTAGGDVTISYRNQTGGDQWHVFIYDPETRTSIQYSGAANNEENRGQVCAYRNGSDVRLYRNASRIANETFDETGSANANLTTANWHGTVEETRFFDDALNASERNETFTNATAPLTTANRTDRIYYDAGQGDSVYAFLSPSEPQAATIGGNYSWQQTGFSGAVMNESNDYNWQESPPAVKRQGGNLTNQPAAWVDFEYERDGMVARVSGGIADAFNLAVVLMLALGGLLVMTGVRFANA